MAKKKAKASKSKAEPQEAVKEADVREQITPRKLQELMRSARVAQKDIAEIAGGFGAEIKAAVEKHHLHRKAFAVVKAGDKMEPAKLAEFLDCLDYYLDVSGLRKRAESVQRMEMGEEPSGDEDGESNVHSFADARKTDEEAGEAASA